MFALVAMSLLITRSYMYAYSSVKVFNSFVNKMLLCDPSC